MGFADRVIATGIAEEFSLREEDRDTVKAIFRKTTEQAAASVERFPTYFQDRMKAVLDD